MTTASTPKAPVPDIGAQIAFAMRNMGVAPIPRNYALFYEAFIGSNPALTKELGALGSRASQEELDEMGSRYFDHHYGRQIETVHDKIQTELESLLGLLKHEQSSLDQYHLVLKEASSGIQDKNLASANILRTAIAILSEATGEKISQSENAAKDFERHAQEMSQVRLELDEYKRIANTDSLTRLSNRRAFDDRLSAVYDTSIGLHLTSLVLLDIDKFKNVNDTYGHPVGDKILATVGSVIRSCVRKDGFIARSGGEEFAIILDSNNAEEIMVMCERIRVALENTPFRNSKSGTDYGPVTISLGYSMASQARNPGELYANADTALYHAKETGRNRSVIFTEGMQKNYSGKSWLIYKK